jgi:hypothetical protein
LIKASSAAAMVAAKPVMPAVAADRIGVGPFVAGILDFNGEAEHRGDAGKRGRRCIR